MPAISGHLPNTKWGHIGLLGDIVNHWSFTNRWFEERTLCDRCVARKVILIGISVFLRIRQTCSLQPCIVILVGNDELSGPGNSKCKYMESWWVIAQSSQNYSHLHAENGEAKTMAGTINRRNAILLNILNCFSYFSLLRMDWKSQDYWWNHKFQTYLYTKTTI